MKPFLRVPTEFDAISDGLWDLDVKNEKICLSPSASKLLCHEHTQVYTREDVLNVYIHKDHKNKLQDEIEKLLKNQSDIIDTEIKLKPKSKECRWIHLKGVPVSRDTDGTPDRLLGSITDITSRKKAEKDIERERKILRTIIDNLPVTIYILDKQGRKILSNKTDCRLIGSIDESEVLGKTDFELYPGTVGERGHKDNMDVINSKAAIFNREEDFSDKNGNQKWLLTSKIPLFDQDNQITGLVGIGVDITEQKSLQKKIIESETYYRTLIEISPNGIITVDLEMNIVYASKKALEIFGIPSETKVRGTSVLNWIIPEYHQEVIERYSNIVAGNMLPVIHEHKLLKYDKTVFWAELSSSPIIDTKGGKTGVLLVCKDISDRKKSEEELKTKHVQLLNAHKIAHLGAWEYEVEKDTFIFNDAFYSIFRTTVDKVGGYEMKSEEYARRFVHPDDVLLVGQEILKAIETDDPGLSRQIEHRFIYADGEAGYLNVLYATVKDERGKTVRTYGVNQDITDRKKSESELIIAKEKAEENDKLKTAFLHNISHEIRTPLNAIVGFSSLLDEQDLSKDEQRSFIEIIKKSSDHLLAIISDIIEISNIEAGIVTVNENELNLNELIEDLYNQFILDSDRKNIQLEYSFGILDENVIIRSDKTKLVQILSNLLSNSLKFTDNGIIKFGYRLEEENILFYVSDTGKGIPPNKFKKIFDRFYQVEHSENRLYEGTGLGLSISKAYVGLLGGQIWLNSRVGDGTTFYFTIPLNRLKISLVNNETFYTKEQTTSTKDTTILVAEDDDNNYRLLCEMLQPLGHNLIRAKDGIEAIEMVKSLPGIDLILMDIKMPNMDGLEATKHIKDIFPDLPIIALTAYTSESDKVNASKIGFLDFISKPYSSKVLIDSLNRIIK